MRYTPGAAHTDQTRFCLGQAPELQQLSEHEGLRGDSITAVALPTRHTHLHLVTLRWTTQTAPILEITRLQFRLKNKTKLKKFAPNEMDF